MGKHDLTVAFMSLFGVIIGGLITYLTQHGIENKKIKREKEKEKALQEIEMRKVYSEILEKDGAIVMFDPMDQSSNFYLENYLKEFRPLLFNKFYLLNTELVVIVQEIDNIIKKNNYEIESSGGDISSRDNDKFISLYTEFIDIVQSKIRNYNK